MSSTAKSTVDSAAAVAAESNPVSAEALHSIVESAVNALFKYKASESQSSGKQQLLPQEDYVYLTITLKKVPSNRPRTSPFRIPLRHPILDNFNSQVCLIVDDRIGSPTPDSGPIKKLIKSQDIPISKVIRLSKLKANYKPFESKRKLCDSYDLFLVDKRVMHLLPKLLGKEFFKKKKLPLGVDLSKKNLKLQVEKALGCGLLYMRTGTCCVMKVGKMTMEKNEIVENVVDAIKGAVFMVPKKWEGVRSLHLKCCDSVALPIYQVMPNVRLKIEGSKKMENAGEVVKSVSDSEVDVKKVSGKKKNKKKGRIHEVRYMDVGEDIVEHDDDDEELEKNIAEESVKGVVSNGEVSAGEKKRKKADRLGKNVSVKISKSKDSKRKKRLITD